MGCHFSAELGRFGHQKMVPNWWTRRPCSWGHSPSGGQYGSGTRGHALGDMPTLVAPRVRKVGKVYRIEKVSSCRSIYKALCVLCRSL